MQQKYRPDHAECSPTVTWIGRIMLADVVVGALSGSTYQLSWDHASSSRYLLSISLASFVMLPLFVCATAVVRAIVLRPVFAVWSCTCMLLSFFCSSYVAAAMSPRGIDFGPCLPIAPGNVWEFFGLVGVQAVASCITAVVRAGRDVPTLSRHNRIRGMDIVFAVITHAIVLSLALIGAVASL